MRNMTVISMFFFLFIIGCERNRKTSNKGNALITVDLTASYPHKELILQDFMDVEYIVLETNDEFLCQGRVLDIGKEIMLVRNNRDDGDIFVFDRKGKGLRKINRRGQGGEEYTTYSFRNITIDEENNEMFVNDVKKINVYNLEGNFLRSFLKNEGTNYSFLSNYNREYLIGRETTLHIDKKSTESLPYVIISKKDGSIIKDFRISFEQGINPVFSVTDGIGSPTMFIDVTNYFNSIIPFHNSWILTELSSDTIYQLLPNYRIYPFMTRTPSIHSSMNPEIFLFFKIFTDRYYFFESFKKTIDRSILGGFPRTNFVFDCQEKTIHKYDAYNYDYVTKKKIDFLWAVFTTYNDNEIVFHLKIEAYELTKLFEEGELKGKLKEIASTLDDDSNPIIMVVKHKK